MSYSILAESRVRVCLTLSIIFYVGSMLLFSLPSSLRTNPYSLLPSLPSALLLRLTSLSLLP